MCLDLKYTLKCVRTQQLRRENFLDDSLEEM